ncbi:hypothetical protein D1872_225550 [compost metagenome]
MQGKSEIPRLIQHRFQNLLMYFRIAHHAGFSYFLPPGLELRLNQGGDIRGAGEQLQERRKNNFQRDKRHVDAGETRTGSVQIGGSHIAKIRPLFDVDTLIVTERPIELIVADIDRVNVTGSVLQCAIGEPSGRGSDIQHDSSVQIDAEFLERFFQL